MRLVIAEDSVLLREGLTGLLIDHGHLVVGRCVDATELMELVDQGRPDVVITDIRMPPTFTDEGARAAVEIRARFPGIGVLVLSQHIETRFAVELVSSGSGFGYLLKDRVLAVPDFLDALERVGTGGSALDPTVVEQLLGPGQEQGALSRLTPREQDVLQLMAEGRSNAAIASALWLAERTVETHVRSIFVKLGLFTSTTDHRRVLAVLTYLRSRGAPAH